MTRILRAAAAPATIILLALGPGLKSWSAGWLEITQSAGLAGFRGTQGSPAKNYIVESIGGGCAFIDYNGDGRLDILLVRGTTLERHSRGGDPVIALYENRGGRTFVDVSLKAGLTARGWGMGVVVADYDNDGWPDFLVTGFGRNFLFHNEGTGRFRELAMAAGVARPGVWSSGAAFGDIDGDGRLDLYIAAYVDLDAGTLAAKGSGVNCVYKSAGVFCGPRGMSPGQGALFRNAGGGKFEDISQSSGITKAVPFYSLQPLVADFDDDGRQDIFVANDSTPNYLYRNKGNSQFEEIGIAAGVGVNMDGRAQACMGADLGDSSNDGRLDLIVTNFSEDTNTLYRNLGKGVYEDASWASKIGPPSWLFLGWGVKFLDYDNDGRLDVIVANGHVYPEADQFGGGSTYRQRLLLHHNRGGGIFDETGAGEAAMANPGTARGLAIGDIDNDGRLDVLVNQQDGPPRLVIHRNAGGHWLQLALRGTRSNRDGVGAVVKVRAQGRLLAAVRLAGDSYLSSSDSRMHFGLGSATKADSIAVQWPSGREQLLTNVAADRLLAVEEPSEP
ncbi:MAG TPA: CRTAC1 family protein [Bryobacteraceae bacterium]|nr:CRTAC1 family protein [Bryobacteraceae bacterium]